jgi:hypothetical protein
MTESLVRVMRRLTDRHAPGRNLEVWDDDTFLVCYPKSGSNWVRFLVANLINPWEPVTLLSAERVIPFVEAAPKRHFDRMPRPRVIKSHYPFHHPYKKVVYVVRDPRDVVISQYFYHLKRRYITDGYSMDRFTSRFVDGAVCSYGSWGEHVASWVGARRSDPNFLLIRYEDLLRQTTSELARIAKLLRVDASAERLTAAVELSSAERMRKLEKVEGEIWNPTRGTRQDISFVRAAKEGQWHTALRNLSVARIETAWGDLIQMLGYQLLSGYRPAPASTIAEHWMNFGSTIEVPTAM